MLFLNAVFRLINRVLRLGTSEVNDPFLFTSIFLCNTVSLASMATQFLFLVMYLVERNYAGVISTINVVGFFFILYVNSNKKYRLGRYATVLSVILGLIYASFLIGEKSQIQLLLLAMFPVTFLIMTPDKAFDLIFVLALIFTSTIFIDVNPFGIFNGEIDFPKEGRLPLLILFKTIILIFSAIENFQKKLIYRELILRKNEISSLLNNMRQAVLRIDKECKVLPGYSRFSLSIFPHPDLEGINFASELLYPSDLLPDQIAQIEAVAFGSIGELSLTFDFNSHLLPKQVHLTNPDRILNLDWVPLMNEENIIETIMVNIRDITLHVSLEDESRKKGRDIEIVRQILNIGDENFFNFMRSSNELIDDALSTVNKYTGQSNLTEFFAAPVFRNIHTIKGNSRVYGFSYISSIAHESETEMLQDSNSNPSFRYADIVLSNIIKVKNSLSDYQRVFTEYLERPQSVKLINITRMTKAFAEEASDIIENASFANKARSFISDYTQLTAKNIEQIIKNQIMAIPEIATTLSIPIPEVSIEHNEILFRSRYHDVLESSINHILRNSIDHGLRKINPQKGHISVRARLQNAENAIAITIRDNGPGLSINAIRETARSKNLIESSPKSNQEIFDLIFMPGFSTRKQTNQWSGRGYGMDYVKTEITKLGGNVTLVLLGDPDDEGNQAFEVRIELPATFSILTTK